MDNTELVSLSPDVEKLMIHIARVSNPDNQDNPEIAGLIHYLIRNKHWSPFEHGLMTVRIKTTRAIAAQILRHRSFTFQEFSQRYSSTEDIDYPEMRYSGSKNRQSSTDVVKDTTIQSIVVEAIDASKARYDKLLSLGVAKECARMVLPLCTPTVIYMSGTIRSWIHYIQLRTGEHTQKEHRTIAKSIQNLFIEQLPIVSDALGWREEPSYD